MTEECVDGVPPPTIAQDGMVTWLLSGLGLQGFRVRSFQEVIFFRVWDSEMFCLVSSRLTVKASDPRDSLNHK